MWLEGIAGSNRTWGNRSLSLVSVVCCQVDHDVGLIALTPPNHASVSQ